MKILKLTEEEFTALFDDIGVEFLDENDIEELREHNKPLASAYEKLLEKNGGDDDASYN